MTDPVQEARRAKYAKDAPKRHVANAADSFFNALDGRRPRPGLELTKSAKAIAAGLDLGMELHELDPMPASGRVSRDQIATWRAVADAILKLGLQLHEAERPG